MSHLALEPAPNIMEPAPLVQRRRAMDDSPSGGMILAGTAAKILGLEPNSFRAAVSRGDIRPAFTLQNGACPPTHLYWRHEVEALKRLRDKLAADSSRAERAKREWRAEQVRIPGIR